MNITGIDFLAQMIGEPIIAGLKEEASLVENEKHCDCCDRPSSEWLHPNHYIECSPYHNSLETHCLSCHMLFASAPAHLGPGRNGKLGMLRGAGCLVSESSKIIYATGKHYERFTSVEEPLFDEVVPLAGLACIGDAISRIPDNEPSLFISDFGVKKASLISNLFVSDGNGRLCLCSEKEHFWVNKGEIITREDLRGIPKDVLSNSSDGWIDLLVARTNRYLTREQIMRLGQHIKEYPALAQATKSLPKDPHTRHFALRVTRKLIEDLK